MCDRAAADQPNPFDWLWFHGSTLPRSNVNVLQLCVGQAVNGYADSIQIGQGWNINSVTHALRRHHRVITRLDRCLATKAKLPVALV